MLVIGGGAAGFFCAVNAARLNPHLQVTILEKTGKLLSKVRVSGGGRCNVTHAIFERSELSKRYPRGMNFIKKTVHQFDTASTIDWFRERGVQIKREEDGRMFPVTDNSETIIDCLMDEARKLGVTIRTNTEVKSILQQHSQFELQTTNLGVLTSDYIVVATGGYPKGVMFDWLKATGHTIAEPVPSLFTFNLPKHPITELMGVAANPVRVKIEGSKLVEEGPVLITHWGMSGPAVLRLSAWGARELQEKEYRFRVHLNWVPQYNEQNLKSEFQSFRAEHPTKKVYNHNFTGLPSRLFQFLLEQSGVHVEHRFAELPAKVENALIRNLVDYVVDVQGKTTFKEEFVTAGGINLSEVDANTMMSRKVTNLFFAGEVMDVDGITGGFNFQHAWSSGFIAAKTIAANT
ncbi:flavoprotein [Cnuella takakiae]|nr:flavoprotein [Cnuella takakiae]